jgi:hypothetical protein
MPVIPSDKISQLPEGQSLGSSHDWKQVYPSVALPAQVAPAQQSKSSGPHAPPSMAHAWSQMLALLSESGPHFVPGQSASVVHVW